MRKHTDMSTLQSQVVKIRKKIWNIVGLPLNYENDVSGLSEWDKMQKRTFLPVVNLLTQ